MCSVPYCRFSSPRIILLAMLVCTYAWAQEVNPRVANTPIAETSAGKIAGYLLGGVYTFKGVPYGASTAGEGRFKAPRPVDPWEGVKDSKEPGCACPQEATVGRRTIHEGDLVPYSEDCLVLNIWTKGLDDGGKRPVMVWLHGRGFYAGAGSEPLYDGTNLADHGDVVVVTVNHRLNVFGYFQLEAVGGEAYADSGIAGMLDIILALEWVRDNAEAFGGDPGNVTIFGNSGGGAKVSTLLGMPEARGLFHRAVIQSGPSLSGISKEDAAVNTAEIMDRLSVDSIDELVALPAADLLKAVASPVTARTSPSMRPVVDGVHLPADMFTPEAAPSAANVPILIGYSKDEYTLYVNSSETFGQLDEAGLMDSLAAYGDAAETLVKTFRTSRPDASPWDLMIAIRSARFGIGTVRLAERAQKVAPVYMYVLEFPSNDRLKAHHGSEIQYIFRNPSSADGSRAEVQAMMDTMSDTWVQFARTGNPNHEGIPEWPTYNLDSRASMVFDTKTKVVNDIRPAERTVWDNIDMRR